MALTDGQAQALRLMMMTEGWNKVLKPWVAERGRRILRAISEPKAARDEAMSKVPTNHLRGRLEEIEWLLSALDNELVVYDANRRRDELARQEEGTDATANP